MTGQKIVHDAKNMIIASDCNTYYDKFGLESSMNTIKALITNNQRLTQGNVNNPSKKLLLLLLGTDRY